MKKKVDVIEAVDGEKVEPKTKRSGVLFHYFEVNFRLKAEMLGTCPAPDTYYNHILKKEKDKIKEAKKLAGKITKAYEKYVGTEIPEWKEIEDLKGVIRSYQAALGSTATIPENIPEILELAKELEEQLDEAIKKGEASRCTTFSRDESGWPRIATYMVLGNFKQNLKTMVNNGDKSIVKYKTSVSECGALDVKWVDPYMKPSQDIIKDSNGEPILLERPILFKDNMGNSVTALALSEQLPIGTEFSAILRVRVGSPFDDIDALSTLLHMGKNCGLGAWRGSNDKGSYYFKIKKLDNYKEVIPDGWS